MNSGEGVRVVFDLDSFFVVIPMQIVVAHMSLVGVVGSYDENVHSDFYEQIFCIKRVFPEMRE